MSLLASLPVRAELVGVLDSSRYEEAKLSDWIKLAPRHVLANNLGLPEEAFGPGRKGKAELMSAV